ncbi:MAG: EFR1 family ferrodoxin [Bacteroidetes bacterium]|nr:EFR1 family ferrodoxin [Bacteroidota bacterium]
MNEKIIIYYFSGTGNAKKVSGWFKSIAELKGRNVSLVDISEIKNNSIKPSKKNVLIGFCSPTHGFNFPPIMFYFILSFPKSNNNRVFILNTRGGTKLGGVHLPGLSGTAQYLTAIILLLKGYKIVGMRSIDMPSNWISLHPALRENAVKFIFKNCETKTKIFAEKIINGQKDFRALLDIVQDILITPISVLYFFIGRYFLAKTLYATRACNNCGVCYKECPVEAIKVFNNRPFWTYKCESCMQCINTCPQKAVNAAHGFAIGGILLINSFIVFYIFSYLNEILFINRNWFPLNLILYFVEWWVGLAFFSLFYRINHFLLQIRLFEKISGFFSFTNYKFWGRYKIPKNFNQ